MKTWQWVSVSLLLALSLALGVYSSFFKAAPGTLDLSLVKAKVKEVGDLITKLSEELTSLPTQDDLTQLGQELKVHTQALVDILREQAERTQLVLALQEELAGLRKKYEELSGNLRDMNFNVQRQAQAVAEIKKSLAQLEQRFQVTGLGRLVKRLTQADCERIAVLPDASGKFLEIQELSWEEFGQVLLVKTLPQTELCLRRFLSKAREAQIGFRNAQTLPCEMYEQGALCDLGSDRDLDLFTFLGRFGERKLWARISCQGGYVLPRVSYYCESGSGAYRLVF